MKASQGKHSLSSWPTSQHRRRHLEDDVHTIHRGGKDILNPRAEEIIKSGRNERQSWVDPVNQQTPDRDREKKRTNTTHPTGKTTVR